MSTAFAVGLSPAPLVTFPAPSLKFRTLSFPQSGFKPRRPSISPCPSRKTSELKRQVRIRSLASRFDSAFVACVPSCTSSWHSQPAPPRAPSATTSAHGSFAPKGFCCPFPPHYYDPIRQSRPLPLPSQVHWLCRRPLPYDLVWAATETFPALGQCSFHTCHNLYAGRKSRAHFPRSKSLLPWPSSLEQ